MGVQTLKGWPANVSAFPKRLQKGLRRRFFRKRSLNVVHKGFFRKTFFQTFANVFSNPSKVFRQPFFLTLAKGLTKGFAKVFGLWWGGGFTCSTFKPWKANLYAFAHASHAMYDCDIALFIKIFESFNIRKIIVAVYLYKIEVVRSMKNL